MNRGLNATLASCLAVIALTACTGSGGAPTPLAALTDPTIGTNRSEPARGATGDPDRAGTPITAETATAAGGANQTALAAPQANLAEGSAGSIRFTPVIGAPISAVTPLSRQLGTEARRRGLAIRSSADTQSDNVLKGYFSALNDNENTTVVFVWDVLDNDGNRLYRIQGQEQVPGASGDPWSSVPASTMEAIANRTIEDYLAWRAGRRG